MRNMSQMLMIMSQNINWSCIFF